MGACCVNADEPLLEDSAQRHGGQFPSSQILGGGSRYPPNSYGQPGYPSNSYGQPGNRPIGTGHLPIENNGQWHSNYQGNHDSYGSHGGHGGQGGYSDYGNYGHQGNYGSQGGHGHRGHHRGH